MLQQLTAGHAFFKEHFVNKRVIYFYKEKHEIKQFSIYMVKTNFMHLCGVKYRGGAASFYHDIQNKTLRIDDIETKSDGTTTQKLQVLPLLHELLNKHVKVCSQGHYLRLTYDKAIRSNKSILAITLKYASTDKYVPTSLLNLRNGKYDTLTPSFPVICIIRECLATKERVYLMYEEKHRSEMEPFLNDDKVFA
ncbi:hypothetical protein HCA69_06030 [Listeria grandensis]|uniref:Phage-Barnase-EndoU-ColicinE5/D-RelE like nuclease 4 domain-containing protein n=2 Tax=Listeria grandensis TaxID=1494963 RepID=A0A7X1CPE7_9LIST|nr:PBECR4 domain-containing protein [Listeria grandensis]MBC1935919.1 hypothetical protein [Listeria grandensis]